MMKNRLHAAFLLPAGMLPALPAVAQRYDDMHGMWHPASGWGHMLFGGLMMVLILGAVIGLIAVVVRSLAGTGTVPPARERERGRSALDILDERYARGEIDRDEYQQRRQDLTR
ncbi:SHOCT domain-containing protein [Aquisalimonas lutea]|uniref:SHOCT domain-containing protein n=1 Tax=Aquisalimonas lutea TaxID=1327750 RepID=UPI0025B61BE1|nr:SHOCT domain-containing protein [Aquisalimonas lutea]MDN3519044.1 SHOCT domain-containing protein [Aquisalimonas lutea]